MNTLVPTIEAAWGDRNLLNESNTKDAIREVISLLDTGRIRVAEKDTTSGRWTVNNWVKEAVLLYFQISQMQPLEVGIFEYYDKILLKNYSDRKSVV